MIGVLGGMGPLATADFFFKGLAATHAQRDEDHVPLLIQSDPRIPGRPAAILPCRLFDGALSRAGYQPLLPTQSDMQSLVLPAIAMVKSGKTQQAGPLVQSAVENLRSNGARAVLLACTETPVALDAIASPARAHCIDSTAALAGRCVRWWQLERLLAPDTGY